MSGSGPFRSVLVCVSAALLFAASAPAQQNVAPNTVAPNAVASNKVALKKFVDATNQLSPNVRKHLSRGMQDYLRYANAVVNGAAPSGKLAVDTFSARQEKGGAWSPWNLIP